jgi:hypothetical protein
MEIVFVHLNTRVPRYLYWNIRTHIERFPEHRVTLIHSKHIKAPSITGLNTTPADEDHRWRKLDQLYNHPKYFRANFWLTSSVRLVALENYLKKFRNEIIHLESDVVLSSDFPFDKFSDLKESLAFPLISNNRGVASVVYIRNIEAAGILTSTLIEEASIDGQTTEMLSIRKVYERFQAKVHAISIGSTPSFFRNIEAKIMESFMESFHHFKGIFDGAEIGQFFFGTDPRNRRGRKLLRNDLINGYIDVTSLALEFNAKRKFVNVISKKESISINLFAIHIPSKETKYFRSKSQCKALKKACKESNRGSKIQVVKKTIIMSIFQSAARRLSQFRGK